MIPETSAVAGSTGAQSPTGDAMQDLGMNDFLKMMIAELQNQDPLNPMDNTQILQQIGQIRDIMSNDKLTNTLEAAFLGQNMATANSMMGEWVVAVDDNGEVQAAGQVDKVLIEDGLPKLHVGNRILKLDDVSQIQNEEQAQEMVQAMALVGLNVVGYTNASTEQLGQSIQGIVEKVVIVGGDPKLLVAGKHLDPGKTEAVGLVASDES